MPNRSRSSRTETGGSALEHVEGATEAPDGHDVRVGVVVEAGLVAVRVALVVLVGTHHAADAVAVLDVVIGRDRRPEPGDLEHHLCAEEAQELEVARRLEVLPDVVGDRRVDVALEVRRVRRSNDPTSG